MSEYQYYEFVALDRPLTPAEMAELRSISTRAQITPTRFFNEYHWGDLKADPAELLVRYFDVHVYFANWGSRRLMFRLPKPAVNLEDLRACVAGGPATLTVTERHVVLDLWSETEEPEEEWFEDGQLLASLTPLRAELLRGDRRVAYLAWLLAVQAVGIGSSDLGATHHLTPGEWVLLVAVFVAMAGVIGAEGVLIGRTARRWARTTAPAPALTPA